LTHAARVLFEQPTKRFEASLDETCSIVRPEGIR
jgi:hypothetical protein